MPSREDLRWIRDQLIQRAKMLRGPLAIFMYHRVCPPTDHPFLQEAGVPWISPELFAEQMRFLRRANFAILDLRQALAQLERREPFEPRSAVITFDDGFRDNLVHAAPILAEQGVKASFFIATRLLEREELLWEHKLFAARDCLGAARAHELLAGALPARLHGGSPWLHYLNYRLPHARRLELGARLDAALEEAGFDQRTAARELYLDPAGVLALRDQGHAIGSHGAGHFHLSTMSAEQKRHDLEEAHRDLTDLLDEDLLPVFSSPYGSHGRADLELLRSLGYRAAAAALFGTNGRRTNPFFLRRIALGERSWHRLRFLERSARWARRLDVLS